MVGVIRFERTTSPSRTVRATKLRHTPTAYPLVYYGVRLLARIRAATLSLTVTERHEGYESVYILG